MPAIPESLAALHDLIARFWDAVERTSLPHPPSEQRLRFALAVIEVGGNIIRYAYPDGAPGLLSLRLRARPDRLEAEYRDQGVRYELPGTGDLRGRMPVFDETLPIEEIPEGGFGLPLVRAAVDALNYTRTPDGWNFWALTSLLTP